MITVEPTTDESYIKSVFLNPTIYASMKDDASPSDPASLMDRDIMGIPGFFLRAVVDGVPAGVWWLIWKDESVEAHTALLENCRGARAIKATRAAIRWVFDNTAAKAITSYAWSDSPAVSWFCRAVGMSPTRSERWPATRNGQAVDIQWFNINRKEGTPCL
jgi:hypothetical protein